MTLAMEKSDPDSQLSSYVWVCTSTKAASTVTVIDAKNPSEVLDSFPICQTNLLCICSVQGALESDYALLENSEALKSGNNLFCLWYQHLNCKGTFINLGQGNYPLQSVLSLNQLHLEV